MWKVTVLVAVTVIGLVESSCMYKGSPCPEYKLIEKHRDYEVREYPAATWVTTSVTSNSRPYAQYNTFMRLYNYTQGLNNRELKMEVTTPTRVETTKYDDQTVYTMGIIIPDNLQSNPPTPTDSRVKLQKEEATTYAVRIFNGYIIRLADWQAEADRMAESLKYDDSVVKDHYFEIGYDGIFEFFDRTNEIWMVKKKV